MQCTKPQSSAFFIRQRPQKVDPGAIIEIVDYNKNIRSTKNFLRLCERRNLSTSTKSSKKRTRKFLTSLTARNAPTAAKIWGRCSPRLILKESPRLSECTLVILKMHTFASTRTATKFSNACRVRFSAQTTFARFTRFVPRHVASFRTRIAKKSIRSTI